MELLYLGIDIGSISINTVLLDGARTILEDHYTYCQGRPFARLLALLEDMDRRIGDRPLALVALTGSGGELGARLLGGHFVNEIIAQATSVTALYPHARSVIEMGGEDSKLIRLTGNGCARLSDFAMNSMCAAGTGSFLDQQATRMGVSIESEFGELAVRAAHPPRIAGRCSVFAKSDMIHLQQIATPLHDIAAGLCFAVALNFKSNLARGRRIEPPVVFQGGVAANAGMVHAFRELLELPDGQLIVPPHHASMGAIGAIYHCLDSGSNGSPALSFTERLSALRRYLSDGYTGAATLPRLRPPDSRFVKEVERMPPSAGVLPVYLGLDVGSLSTNLVLIDDENRVIARRYLPTASRPLEAIQRGLAEIADEVKSRVDVRAVGTTGSGRYLTGDFVGADVTQNEITAQATAAVAADPAVDTVFEIGGQDSKYIRIHDGVVVDFEMNKVCAAGTGSFLEEQAEKLGISIIDEFGELALSAQAPVRLGDRCTVFMESDLNSHQQKGASTADLVGGLAYSIVYNYLQKVVGTKPVGKRIFFQGGVANNRAVVSAFAAVTDRPITVPPHFDVTGAIGAAMLARQRMRNLLATNESSWHTRFKGFDVARSRYTMDRFGCHGCSNQCEIHRVRVEGERRSLCYGGRCERWESAERKGRRGQLPNLFDERTALLLAGYDENRGSVGDDRPTIGIPRALSVFYSRFPFWRAFFESLGFRVLLSRPTDRGLITRSLETLQAETCFPVEVVYGHVMDLLDRGTDYVFLPFVVSERPEPGNTSANYNCPWVQTYPFMIRAALAHVGAHSGGRQASGRLLTPVLHFRYYEHLLPADLERFMAESFGRSRREVRAGLHSAEVAQDSFESAVRARGREVLLDLPPDKEPVVILGRPYNLGDPSLNLSLATKLEALDVFPIPLDFLPLDQEAIWRDYYMMYWPNGRNILAAARIVNRDPRLQAIYLGNFRCGPDSFLSHYVRRELSGKPYLQLEVDEHSADAGLLTRCEAFLDSVRARRGAGSNPARPAAGVSESPPAAGPQVRSPAGNGAPRRGYRMGAAADERRTLYIPYMCDGAHALAAASRHCGIDAQVLPMQGDEEIALARRSTSGKECFPAICTLGSFLRKMKQPGFVPERASFFMPDHGGPCRFGQYNKLQRIIFDSLGFGDVEIVAPSNEDGYAGLSGGRGNRFRLTALKGVFAVDLLRKLKQEFRPYEAEPGRTDRIYAASLARIVRSTEGGASDIARVLEEIAEEFRGITRTEQPRRPVVAIVGEIFMRDNPAGSAFLVDRLERLGAETLMAPFIEWLTYSTLRYARDSVWKRDAVGLLRARMQDLFMRSVMRRLYRAVRGVLPLGEFLEIGEMLTHCEPYIHRDYDGDPAVSLGAAHLLASRGVSGVAHILPFTCLPGTVVTAVSPSFREDHRELPWVNVDYDGQEETAIETRLQAFMHQVVEFHRSRAAS